MRAPLRRLLADSTPVRAATLLTLACLGVLGLTSGCGGSEASGVPSDAPVEIQVRWEIDDRFPATMTIHEPPAGQDVYEIRTYGPGEVAEVGDEIPGGVLYAEYSEPRRFIARLQNDSDEVVRFWVAPHLPTPHVSEQGLTMFCLCTGQVYEVPAHGTWTRVMEFGVTRRANLEGPIALTHVIVRGEIVEPTPRPREDAR
jgi:hypothetical protein